MKHILQNLLCSGLVLISLSAQAEVVNYKIEMTLTLHQKTDVISVATCSVGQTFTETDASQVWDCSFNRGPQVQLTTQADRIGIWSGGEAYYSENLVYQGSELGRFIHHQFGIEGVTNNAFLQVVFAEGAPEARENPIYLKTEKDWYDLNLKFSY